MDLNNILTRTLPYDMSMFVLADFGRYRGNDGRSFRHTTTLPSASHPFGQGHPKKV